MPDDDTASDRSQQPASPEQRPTPLGAHTNANAIASLICAIANFILIPVIGAVLAVIFGIIALRQIKRTHEQGRAMAIVGIALGAVGLVILVLLMLLGFIAYFGILSPERMLPASCLLSGGFSIGECSMGDDALTIEVINNLGADVSQASLTFEAQPTSAIACNDDADLGAMANGESRSVQLCHATYQRGDRLKGNLIVTYTKVGDQISHEATGHINVVVE